MKKFTLFATAALAMSAFTANAELMDKYFYKISTENSEGWTLQDAGRMSLTPGKDYLEVKLTNNGGRMINRFWNEDGWSKVTDLSTLPNNTYKFSMDLAMTVNSTRSDMEFVLLPVGACTSSDSRVSTHNYHWFNAQDAEGADGSVVEDYFFRYRVVSSTAEEYKIVINENPTARNNWPDVTETSDTLILYVGNKYSFDVDINVAEKTATYTIGLGADVVKTGVHKYVCAEDRAGIWVMSANSANSVMQLSRMGLSYKKEGPFAGDPSAELFWVEGAERDYMATFHEGEVLHWIQLGDAEDVVSGESYTDGQECTIAYGDASDTKEFEAGEDFGRKIITCNKSGDLKIWTSMVDDETNTSDELVLAVDCAEITLPTPVATITNVEEGYSKEYTISVDNSEIPLKPTVTIHYKMSNGKEGDIYSGETVKFTEAGSVELFSMDKTHKTECYGRSETITINNDVEYVLVVDKNFKLSIDDINANNPGFHTNEIIDSAGKSHWDRIMSSEKRGYKEDGTNEVFNADNAANYTWVKEGHGLYADTDCGTENAKWTTLVADNVLETCLPLYPSEEDLTLYVENAWAYFPYEGVVYYDVNSTAAVKKNPAGAAGYVEMALESRYVTDDEAKPNFYIVYKTGGYNRPDKGDCTSSEVLTTDQKFWLYRYDTAISSLKVLTYKGFVLGIEAIESEAPAQEATIWNINGQRVNAIAAPGLYIKGGKTIMVK